MSWVAIVVVVVSCLSQCFRRFFSEFVTLACLDFLRNTSTLIRT